MAEYIIDRIQNGSNVYIVRDSGALQLTGGTVTGPVNFNDSVSIDEATIGDLVVTGVASTVNNLQANTINGVSVGNDPKFTDTVTTVTTSGSGNAITAISASNGALTATKGSTFSLSNHTHSTSIASSTGTNQLTLESGGKYSITAGGTSYVFTMPSDIKVRQTYTSDSSLYPLLMTYTSGTGGSTARDDQARLSNGIYAKPSESAIYASAVKADQGVFNKLVAADATFTNATVVGLLDVQGEFHTNSWTNSNIANIGGVFYISPTVSAETTTVTLAKSGSEYTITVTAAAGTFATTTVPTWDGTTSSTSGWLIGSRVIMTGSVVYNNVEYPLGTCKGYLTNALTGTGFKMQNITSSALDVIYGVAGTNSLSGKNIQLSMYEIGPGNNNNHSSLSAYKPVGILMTSYGLADKSTHIDIYGGVKNKESSTATSGMADPSLRIGYLGGLDPYTDSAGVSHQPTGWGIYTDNGYFKGVIVADSGSIGNFKINANAIYSGSHSAYNSNANGIFLGNSSSDTSTYYIAGGSGAKWYLKSDGSAKIGAMELTSAGVLSVPAANITGTLAASQIDVTGVINAGHIVTNTLEGGTRGSNSYIYVSTNNSGSLEINTITKSDWRLILGNTFGIDQSGYITASTGKIGGWKLNANSFSVDKDFIIDNVPTTTYDYIVFSNGELSSSKKVLDRDSTDWNMVIGNSFGITSGGSLYSSSATIAEGVLGPFSLDENGLNYEKNQTYQMFNNYPSGTYNGITFSQSGRQVILYGTATANTSLYCRGQTTGAVVPVADFGANTSWTFGGSPEGGSTTTYRTVGCFTADGTTPSGDGTTFYEYGSGESAEGYRYATLKIYLRSGKTYGTEQNPLIFTPYLKDATGKDHLENFSIVASTDSFSFGENSFVRFSANGEASIGKEGLGDYLKYTLTGYNGNITFKATSIDSIGGAFTNLVTNNLTATSIALGEQDLSTRLTNLGGGIEAVQANVNSLSANLSTNYYTKANIEAIQSTINNTITQNIGVVTQSINQINSTIESMQNTFGVNVEFYFAKNSVKKWQMRLGKEVVTGKPNLNDIWVE